MRGASARAHRLALADVGCDPARFGASPAELHAHNTAILGAFPLTMTTTATHDTKRSEDVRTRLAVLSEVPDARRTAVAPRRRLGEARIEIGEGPWRNAFTNERLEGANFALRDVLATFPVAWLVAE